MFIIKVLITGGAGFISYHTSIRLLERGDSVVLVDNFNDYYDPSLKEARIESLKEKFSEGIEVEKVDIADYDKMDEVFKKHQPDKVLNLAAQAGVRYSLENPFAYQETNIKGFLNILELCRHNNVKDLIFASSSSVYGNNKKMPFSEEDRVDTPISLYAASKKNNEEMAYTYHHLFGLNTIGLRFFTVYGPWGRPDMALFMFTKNTIEGKPINVFNHGKMKRDFTYVTDIAQGVIGAIDNCEGYDIYNLARGECVELTKYISEIEKNLGKEAIKNMMEMQPGDVPATSAVIDKAQDKLGYAPEVSVEEGIKNFIDWYKDYYGVE